MFAPAVECAVGLGGCIFDDGVFPRAVDAADFVRQVDGGFAELLLGPVYEDFVKVGVIDVILANEGGDYIRCEILENVQLDVVSTYELISKLETLQCSSILLFHDNKVLWRVFKCFQCRTGVLTAGTARMSPYPYRASGLTSSFESTVKLFVRNHSSPETARLLGTPFL